jgi:hypothetical protein
MLRVDLPGKDQPMDPAPIAGSLPRIKELIESGDAGTR